MKRRPTVASGMVGPADLALATPSLIANAPALFGGRPRWPAPTFVRWILTERCPLRCPHCDMGRPGPELDHNQRLEIAHRLGRSRVWGVSLIGGEVATVRHLADYAAALRRDGRFILAGLSGFGLDRHLDGLLEAGINGLVFSVDGADAASHDDFRGRPGLYVAIESACERIARLPARRRPRTQVRFTINRLNLHHTLGFIETWSQRVDNVILQIVQSNGLHTVRDPDQVMFRAEDRAELTEVLAQVARRHPQLADNALRHMAEYALDSEGLRRRLGFRCVLVPATQAAVATDGGVTLCNGRPDSAIGNLLRSDLEELWRSEGAAATRRRMQAADYGCMCWEAASAGNLELVAAEKAARRLAGALMPGSSYMATTGAASEKRERKVVPASSALSKSPRPPR